jgi:hypothetical protein
VKLNLKNFLNFVTVTDVTLGDRLPRSYPGAECTPWPAKGVARGDGFTEALTASGLSPARALSASTLETWANPRVRALEEKFFWNYLFFKFAGCLGVRVTGAEDWESG